MADIRPPVTVLIQEIQPNRCVAQNRFGVRCKRSALGNTHLCRAHRKVEETKRNAATMQAKAGPRESREFKKGLRMGLGNWVISQNAQEALRQLGFPDRVTDPKAVLMDTVRSAWRQRQIWEALLESIPPEDWSHLGEIPLPTVRSSAIGARIEIITKSLAEATKTAARASKLAIDAGIEERLVRLAEEQSALIADTVRAGVIAGIGALRLSPAAEAAAIEAALGSAATHLRALAAGGNDIIEGIAEEVEADEVEREAMAIKRPVVVAKERPRKEAR